MTGVRGTSFVVHNKLPFNHTSVYAGEETVERRRLVAKGTNKVIGSLEPSAPPPELIQTANDLIHNAHITEFPLKP